LTLPQSRLCHRAWAPHHAPARRWLKAEITASRYR
jgi:hypothetical protein